MQFSRALIEKYKNIVKQYAGVELDNETANLHITNLLALFEAIADNDTPTDQEESLVEERNEKHVRVQSHGALGPWRTAGALPLRVVNKQYNRASRVGGIQGRRLLPDGVPPVLNPEGPNPSRTK